MLQLKTWIMTFLFLFTQSLHATEVNSNLFTLACQDSQASTNIELQNSKVFFKQVLKQILARVEASFLQMQNIEKCVNSLEPQCEELHQWAHIELPKYLRAARFHLSLAQSADEFRTWLNLPNREINRELKNLGSYKLVNWSPLNINEQKKAETQLRKYLLSIDTEANLRITNKQLCPQCKSKFVNESFIAIRYQHFQSYRKMLAELPLIQYFKDAEVSSEILANIFMQMRMDLHKEVDRLNEYQMLVDNQSEELDPKALELLNYSSEVEEALLSEPRQCALASHLIEYWQHRNLTHALALGLPLLTASIFAPPLAGSIIGLSAGSYFALMSFHNYRQTEIRALGYIYRNLTNNELNDLEQSYDRAVYDTITLPLGMGLAQRVVNRLKLSASAFKFALQLFSKAD